MFLKQLNKDKIRRILSKSVEIKIVVLKTLITHLKGMKSGLKASQILKNFGKINRNCFFSRTNNICTLTGRQSGVYKILKISRIEIRDSKHDIYGLRKSS